MNSCWDHHFLENPFQTLQKIVIVLEIFGWGIACAALSFVWIDELGMKISNVRTLVSSVTGLLALAVMGLINAYSANASGLGNLYDMSVLLNQPHPFSTQAPAAFVPAPAMPIAQVPIRALPAPRSQSVPVQYSAVQKSAPADTSSFVSNLTSPKKWVSEVRVGVQKHAASMIGNTTKETGIDGNFEVLFVSPDFMKYIWSPRPHIGGSINGSSNNTDFGYGGVTWEWNPWKTMFIDVSFGFAVHNGRLSLDPGVTFPEDANRRREMGCTVLFRESLEAGFIVAKHHGISVVWDHLSNAGLCAQNEGLDNVGVRYGYRF